MSSAKFGDTGLPDQRVKTKDFTGCPLFGATRSRPTALTTPTLFRTKPH
ncbi:hypothetical protein Mal65_48130 [Crateriforma conspicua]|nr:hypothetical protein Mal65_48130 [Crateriforma conspicua]